MRNCKNFHDISAVDACGRTVRFEAFKGRVCIVVNIESVDSFAEDALRRLSRFMSEDRESRYEMLLFPSRQHLPAEYQKISAIRRKISEYSVSFRLFDFVEFDGRKIHPLYLFLSDKRPCWYLSGRRSNFTKFVVDEKGAVVHRYLPKENPSHHDRILRVHIREEWASKAESEQSRPDLHLKDCVVVESYDNLF
ncbi:UNVERIFIED_CONTAM: hypothetical protein PYX00_011393 [Menopon gallinae]|uniref:Uncharacterized protein n=1 Tax=Menopon gallinae TaxID=328185 RepID=A0AAW2H797_9NEOP